MLTSTTTLPPSTNAKPLSPHPTLALLAARSVITLYPSASSSSQPTNNPSPNTMSPSPPTSTIPPTAFWAVLAALIALLILLALAFPLWYFLRHRRRHHHHSKPHPPTPTLSLTPPDTTPTPQPQPQPPQCWALSPFSQQQFHLLQALGAAHSVPATPSPPHQPSQRASPNASGPAIDANTRTLLSRLRQLTDPSVLGAIPESTVLTSASSARPLALNPRYQGFAERRLGEARGRGEVDGGEDGGEKGGKKVRWREREWAVLGSEIESAGGAGRGGGGGGGM